MAESKHIGGHPNIWGHPNIQWVHPKILANPNKWGCPNMEGDIQTYRGFPNIQGTSKHKRGIQNVVGVQTYGGIKTYSKCIQTYGASKCMGTYGHPLVSQSMLSLCCVCMGHPNIIKTYRGSSKHMLGVSKQMGCPNIQGAFLHAFLPHKVGFATSIVEDDNESASSEYVPCVNYPNDKVYPEDEKNGWVRLDEDTGPPNIYRFEESCRNYLNLNKYTQGAVFDEFFEDRMWTILSENTNKYVHAKLRQAKDNGEQRFSWIAEWWCWPESLCTTE